MLIFRLSVATTLIACLAMTAPALAKESSTSKKETVNTSAIPGYSHGTEKIKQSPVTLADLELLKATVLLSDSDVEALRMSRAVLADQTEAVLDVWYGFVASNPHLVASFARKSDGKPDAEYLGAVRKRFGQWILDTADARFDQAWLDWQHEIGLRHHRSKKNATDGVKAADIVPFRYIPALVIPVTTTLRPFLEKKGHSKEDVDRMHAAWVKSVTLQAILWTYPYVREGDF